MDRRVLEAKDFQVRNYHQSDREPVRAICCETGFLGNPIDPVFEDRELFADFLTDYYLKHEPDSAFVVVKGNVVKGYLLGSRRPLSYQVHGSEVHPGLPSTPRDLFPLSARSWRQTGTTPRWLHSTAGAVSNYSSAMDSKCSTNPRSPNADSLPINRCISARSSKNLTKRAIGCCTR